ncbi:kinetochore protein Spc24 [Sinocyclocheilus anshuiensis]|uniref:kinetochore protein Spc24 n=1 Tax=Sinocyclocheilus anshuiensis TaxID=1608454 RepID=UPI0007B86771|nr:PREDICTED: kinetochore protein Spc24 [Sinocyclocheilus anshuiensis]
MAQNDAMHDDDLAKSGEALIEFIKSSKAESALRGARENLQEFFDHHIKTKKTTTELLNDKICFVYLQKELERLRDTEQEIQTLQQEVDEDTTEVIPSAIYVAQLYFKVTKIKLEVDTEPHILRGVHYGADVAAPINIDTSTRSPCEISDDLWSLVNTEW